MFNSWVGKTPWRRDRICLQCRRSGFNPWVGKIPPTLLFQPGEFQGVAKSQTRLSNFHFTFIPNYRFPSWLLVKNWHATSTPGSGRSPGEGNGNPLQYSCLENPMEGPLVGYSSWGLKRIRHDLATKQLHPKLYTCSTCSKV